MTKVEKMLDEGAFAKASEVFANNNEGLNIALRAFLRIYLQAAQPAPVVAPGGEGMREAIEQIIDPLLCVTDFVVQSNERRHKANAILALLSGAALTAQAALIAGQAWEIGELRADALRYHWLRDGNAYAPEESHVTGGAELDELCDQGIAASASMSPSQRSAARDQGERG